MTDDELEQLQKYERSTEFYRAEMRNSSKGRTLDCGHRIDRGEPYRYSVWKIWGVPGVTQSYQCDVCMRHGNKY